MTTTRTVRDIMNDLIEIHGRSTGYNDSCMRNGWRHCQSCRLGEALRLLNAYVVEKEQVHGAGNV